MQKIEIGHSKKGFGKEMQMLGRMIERKIDTIIGRLNK